MPSRDSAEASPALLQLWPAGTARPIPTRVLPAPLCRAAALRLALEPELGLVLVVKLLRLAKHVLLHLAEPAGAKRGQVRSCTAPARLPDWVRHGACASNMEGQRVLHLAEPGGIDGGKARVRTQRQVVVVVGGGGGPWLLGHARQYVGHGANHGAIRDSVCSHTRQLPRTAPSPHSSATLLDTRCAACCRHAHPIPSCGGHKPLAPKASTPVGDVAGHQLVDDALLVRLLHAEVPACA